MKTSTAWFLACRPKTLSVSLSPVLVGTAVAWHDSGTLLWLPLLAAAFGAAFIQIGTNLFNDVGDFLRGTDTPDRLGPKRATAEGWLTPDKVKAGAWLSFALAFLCGIYLVAHGGWPIVAIGLASLAAGWAYTGGPKPIAYGPLGEVFVFIFFGLVAVGGSYYLQTLEPDADGPDRRNAGRHPRRRRHHRQQLPRPRRRCQKRQAHAGRPPWPAAHAPPLRRRNARPLRPAAAARRPRLAGGPAAAVAAARRSN